MRITIEPTGPIAGEYLTVSVTVPHDDVDAPQVIRMLRGLLLAAGFHSTTVDEYLPAAE